MSINKVPNDYLCFVNRNCVGFILSVISIQCCVFFRMAAQEDSNMNMFRDFFVLFLSCLVFVFVFVIVVRNERIVRFYSPSIDHTDITYFHWFQVSFGGFYFILISRQILKRFSILFIFSFSSLDVTIYIWFRIILFWGCILMAKLLISCIFCFSFSELFVINH